MPKLTRKLPSYRLHRASGQALVTLNGKDHYLGLFGSTESRKLYNELCIDWIASRPDAVIAPESKPRLEVRQLMVIFLRHARQYYRHPDGRPTGEAANFIRALGPLRTLFANIYTDEFSPLKLKQVRDEMIRRGWVRNSINRNIDRIRQMFCWATAEELVGLEIHQALQTVSGLRAGRDPRVKDREKVRPVSQEIIDATCQHLSPVVRDMVQLQLLTGARPGDICNMQWREIDRSQTPWTHCPASHKNAHRDQDRIIPIGPRARDILQKYIWNTDGYVFSPAYAETLRRKQQHANRVTPLSCGNRPGSNQSRSPNRTAGDHYDVASYRRAIARACDAAFPPPLPLRRQTGESVRACQTRLTEPQQMALKQWQKQHRWHPHQLRHAAATEWKQSFGAEATLALLGDRSSRMLNVYAERSLDTAKKIAELTG